MRLIVAFDPWRLPLHILNYARLYLLGK
jgi:hypothetical protein